MKWHDNEAYTSLILIIIGCALFLLLTGCGGLDARAHDAAWQLKQRFTYESDVIDTWRELPDYGPVSGDCDDFAVTIHQQLKDKLQTSLWYVDTNQDGSADHLVAAYLCGIELCIIENNAKIYKESNYHRRLLRKPNLRQLDKKVVLLKNK